MLKRNKKLTLSDLEKSWGRSDSGKNDKKSDKKRRWENGGSSGLSAAKTSDKNKEMRSLCSYHPPENRRQKAFFAKIKYFFSSDNKEAAQHLLVVFGVVALILLSCAAVNKAENSMNPQERQAVAESVLNGSAYSSVSASDKKNKTETKAAEGEALNSDSDYFVNYEMEREKVRSEQLELLNEMAADSDTLPDVKKEAENKILAITEGMENELLLESLLVAKYGGEAVVFVQEDKVNVILRPQAGKINDGDADKIAQLVDTYTGIGYENAIIVIKD